MAALGASVLGLVGPAASQQGEAPPPAVVVAPVTTKAVSSSTEFIGQTGAFHTVDLRARVRGFLTERTFEEGHRVAEGDVLYVIDPSEYDAARDAAEARVKGVEATIAQAEAQLARYEKLATTGTASEASLDEARAAAGRARADLAAAKAELEQASLNLGYTRISSPISGRISRSSVDTGNLVGPDSGVLATVVATNPVYVTFSVTERDYLAYLKAYLAGNTTAYKPQIRLVDGTVFDHDGKIDFFGTEVDAATGTIPFRAVFANPDGVLLPGQFVTVVLVSSEPTQEIVVPQAAIQQNQAGYFVLVVDADSKVEQRSVTLGERQKTEVVVASGLEVGEQIIVEGIQKVRPGATVTAVPQGEASQ
ncbi:efflux RND transporter periplasmic adaptor subunit [Microbaculum sp. FT89]|uniref:efflux RND transporter periplasmic adaptor subunit n=1 Tax=Microbaculum sp. FT89 TaxID=3447298 RepID=UPI003F531639